MITLTVNGKPRDLEGPQNLVDYLEALGITQRAIAIAYNGDIIRKNELQEVTSKTATSWKSCAQSAAGRRAQVVRNS